MQEFGQNIFDDLHSFTDHGPYSKESLIFFLDRHRLIRLFLSLTHV